MPLTRKSLRIALMTAVGFNLLLATGLGWFWWRQHAHPSAAVAVPASSAPPDPNIASRVPPLAPLQLSPQRLQSIDVRTGIVQVRSLSSDLITTGNVAVDEQLQSTVQLRFPGWVRQVFANTTWQRVSKGETLLTIYSPDLVTTEREYLLARANLNRLRESPVPGVAADARILLAAARERLRQWEVPDSELRRLERTGRPSDTIPVHAPSSGWIAQRNVLPNQYVQPQTVLYTLAGLTRVWIYAQVFQDEIGGVRPGDRAQVTVDSYPGRIFPARVDFIWPEVDPSTRTVRVRLVLDNPGLRLKPGMFVNVQLREPMGTHLAVPTSAVLQTGTSAIVFVDRGDGNLQPRTVALGAQTGDHYIVRSGLKAGEKIVTSANFLIDSESQLQAALGAFTPPPPPAAARSAANAVHLTLHTVPSPLVEGTNQLSVQLVQNGKPVRNAQVTVTFTMPAMPAMGMAAIRSQASLSLQADGSYAGSIRLASGGAWQVSIVATANGNTIASRHFTLTAAGGM